MGNLDTKPIFQINFCAPQTIPVFALWLCALLLKGATVTIRKYSMFIAVV